MKKILTALSASIILVLSGCHGTPTKTAAAEAKPAAAASSAEVAYKAAHAAASAAIKKAGSVDGQWRDSGKMLKAAEKAAKSGSFYKAKILARKAGVQGQLGYTQAMEEKGTGNPGYLYQ